MNQAANTHQGTTRILIQCNKAALLAVLKSQTFASHLLFIGLLALSTHIRRPPERVQRAHLCLLDVSFLRSCPEGSEQRLGLC